MGANCAVLTYDGTAHFGFSCDVHATPDSHLLPKFLQESVDELRQAFDSKKDKKEKKTRQASKPRVKKTRAVRTHSPKPVSPPVARFEDAAKPPEPPTIAVAESAPEPAPELALAATAD